MHTLIQGSNLYLLATRPTGMMDSVNHLMHTCITSCGASMAISAMLTSQQPCALKVAPFSFSPTNGHDEGTCQTQPAVVCASWASE